MEAQTKLNLTYTPAEAAKLIGIGLNTMYALIHSERIRTIQIGRKYIITGNSIASFLHSLDD